MSSSVEDKLNCNLAAEPVETSNGCCFQDDDSDSLASGFSDYNLFYDAPIIPVDQENALNKSSSRKTNDSNFIDGSSTDLSFDENRTDEFVDLLCIEDDVELDAPIPQSLKSDHDTTIISNRENDIDADRELEEYLNDDEESESQHDRTKLEKLKQLDALDLSLENYELFQKMAIERHGLLNKRCRRRVWPLLILQRNRFFNQRNDEDHSERSLGEMIESSLAKFREIGDEEIKNNSYYNQVTLDVVRTLKRFPPEISDRLRSKLQKQLIDLICKILIKYGHLHYYQGYHDICLTFLLVSGAEQSIPLLEQLTLSHLTCYMETTMESTLKLLFNIMPLIDQIDSRVSEHIQKAELGVIFGLSWLITWYSHVMDNLMVILRLYDFFIATHPLMPIYVGAIMITDKADIILSTECEMASLHTIITKFPSHVNDLDQLEEYIEKALELFRRFPPDKLADLNEKWLLKCKQIQDEQLLLEKLEKERRVRQRLNKRKNKNNTDELIMETPRRGRHMSLVQQQQYKNRLLFGLTVTVGVAAVAMYAINSKDPQDIISKFYHLLSYKNF